MPKTNVIKFEGFFFEDYCGQIRFSGECVYENGKVITTFANRIANDEYFETTLQSPTCLNYSSEDPHGSRSMDRQRSIINELVTKFFSDSENVELTVGRKYFVRKGIVRINILIVEKRFENILKLKEK